MSRFQKLSHVLWYCQYHIVFVPKYRFRILKGELGKYVYKSLYAHTERAGCDVVELNVQPDHVHLLVKVPPKVSISTLMGRIKGKTAIQAFQKFPSLQYLRHKTQPFQEKMANCQYMMPSGQKNKNIIPFIYKCFTNSGIGVKSLLLTDYVSSHHL